jgi:hypothetical protein
MMHQLLLWAIRLSVLLLVVATGLPLLRSGFWLVRLCDFPRLQIAALFGLAVAIVVVYALATSWTRELYIYCGVTLLLGLWQVAHIVPYTPLWRPEIRAASASGGGAFGWPSLISSSTIPAATKPSRRWQPSTPICSC